MLDEVNPTVEEFAAEHDVSVGRVERELASAILPPSHVDARTFAWLMGTTIGEIVDASEAELEPAVTQSGHLDLLHEASLKFAAARPYGKSGPQEGALHAALDDEDDNLIHVTHPHSFIFFARTWGSVPTREELLETAAQ